jgi:hypothetical protein
MFQGDPVRGRRRIDEPHGAVEAGGMRVVSLLFVSCDGLSIRGPVLVHLT